MQDKGQDADLKVLEAFPSQAERGEAGDDPPPQPRKRQAEPADPQMILAAEQGYQAPGHPFDDLRAAAGFQPDEAAEDQAEQCQRDGDVAVEEGQLGFAGRENFFNREIDQAGIVEPVPKPVVPSTTGPQAVRKQA